MVNSSLSYLLMLSLLGASEAKFSARRSLTSVRALDTSPVASPAASPAYAPSAGAPSVSDSSPAYAPSAGAPSVSDSSPAYAPSAGAPSVSDSSPAYAPAASPSFSDESPAYAPAGEPSSPVAPTPVMVDDPPSPSVPDANNKESKSDSSIAKSLTKSPASSSSDFGMILVGIVVVLMTLIGAYFAYRMYRVRRFEKQKDISNNMVNGKPYYDGSDLEIQAQKDSNDNDGPIMT